MNRKKNEQKLINNFKKIFGKPEETIVIFGDFEQKQHMKYKEPIKGKECECYLDKIITKHI